MISLTGLSAIIITGIIGVAAFTIVIIGLIKLLT
tara:strand:- start:226 stop:327 length:102 start_codon:yes stop_codon:yes gene_type:complete